MKEKKLRFPKTRESFALSMNKNIDGKTMLLINLYVLTVTIMETYAFMYPTVLNPFVKYVISLIISVGVWMLCVLFNIQNPSAAKMMRDVAEFLIDESKDDHTMIQEIIIYLSALSQKYMKIFGKEGERIRQGLFKKHENLKKINEVE